VVQGDTVSTRSLLLEEVTVANKDKGGSKSSKTAASKSLKEKREAKKAKAAGSSSSSSANWTKKLLRVRSRRNSGRPRRSRRLTAGDDLERSGSDWSSRMLASTLKGVPTRFACIEWWPRRRHLHNTCRTTRRHSLKRSGTHEAPPALLRPLTSVREALTKQRSGFESPERPPSSLCMNRSYRCGEAGRR